MYLDNLDMQILHILGFKISELMDLRNELQNRKTTLSALIKFLKDPHINI
jgi:hypothetical protein